MPWQKTRPDPNNNNVADCSSISGWAWDANKRTQPINVDIYDGSTLISTLPAATFDQGLLNWGFGDGKHAFSIATPASLLDGKWHLITVKYGGTQTALNNSPRAINACTAAAQAKVYYIHADQLDTPRVITDTAGNVVWQWDNVDPFGNNMANENPTGAGAFKFDLRFPGQYFDKETNTHYNYFRDYDPATGRYIESDPIGLAGGSPSLYTYVNGNPLRYVDPTGQSALGAAAIGVLTFVTGYGLYDAYQASKPDSCDCKAKVDKAKKILQALRQKFPSRYNKDLSVGVRDIPIGGVTYITNGDKIFISSEWCSAKYPWLTDADLADTVAHEALHANDPWYLRVGPVIGSEFDNGTHHSDTARQGTSDAQAVMGGR